MIKVETRIGQVVIHVDDEGAATLAEAGRDATRNGPSKVFIGDAGAMLIIRHVDFRGTEAPTTDEEQHHG